MRTQPRHQKQERFEPNQPHKSGSRWGLVGGKTRKGSRFLPRRLGRKLKLGLIVIESLLGQINRTMNLAVRAIINESQHHLDGGIDELAFRPIEQRGNALDAFSHRRIELHTERLSRCHKSFVKCLPRKAGRPRFLWAMRPPRARGPGPQATFPAARPPRRA